MNMDVGKRVLVSKRLAEQADFGLPVFLSESLYRTYFAASWMEESEREGWIHSVLRECRKMIDAYRGDLLTYEFQSFLPVGVHACCGAVCKELVNLRAEYSSDNQDDVTLAIGLSDAQQSLMGG